jgi:hypothetical protein
MAYSGGGAMGCYSHSRGLKSQIDCGSFVYGSATKSKLSIIDPAHNTAIRLATGAFRTSRLESLYAESGDHPENFRRNLLLCGYAAKLTTQPHHPSYRAVFKPTLRNRYELNVTASRPVGVRFSKLLQLLNIRLPQIIPCKLSNSTMGIIRPTCNLPLLRHTKGTSASTYRQVFRRTCFRLSGLHGGVH